MIRKGKSKYQGTLESVDSSCDITISYQTMYYKNQIVSTYNTNWFLSSFRKQSLFPEK
jgi:small nuclear ribonucleoprotein (snRNP)-like protein